MCDLHFKAKWPIRRGKCHPAQRDNKCAFPGAKDQYSEHVVPLRLEKHVTGLIQGAGVQDTPGSIHMAANKIAETPIPVEPGLKTIAIGFPQGISTGPGLPVIKSGFLSSMRGFEIRLGGKFSDIAGMKGCINLPAILLDVHTIPGMSGSPVFGEYTGFWNPSDGSSSEIADSSIFGTSRKFLGCYSSRAPDLEERSGLGLCLQMSAIEEICLNQCRGQRFPRSDTGITYV